MAAYYNEIDPFNVQWLKKLIEAGLIAPGDVDGRSIAEVTPSDLAGYDQCHFFAGIGGWSQAIRLAGISDTAPIWTGSCPCQPLSVAGQRKGHADERHLWPAFYGLIAKCSPAIVFGEQVASKDGAEWLSAVRSDLESAGYAIGSADLCATAFGFRQKRNRLFFFADSGGTGAARWPEIVRRHRRNEMVETYREYADWRESCETGVLDDGISVRLAKALTKGFGNAIIPGVAAEFIKCAG
jgi:DNA (cytosine-5)-methyltransferase 1